MENNSEKMRMESDTDPMEKIKAGTISLSARLRKFSDESVHDPGKLTAISDVSLAEDSVIKCIVTEYYGNGNNEDNKGYVSIVFNCHLPLIFKKKHDFNFSCVAAVRDSTGNKKFVRTFTFPYDAASQNAGNDLLAVYSIDQYIARETILDNRDDLLPDDVLTLDIEVSVQAISAPDISTDIELAIDFSFDIEDDSEGRSIVLSLNSELAKHLYEESSVFRAKCDNPMIENSTGLVHLHETDQCAFRNASRIIMGGKTITFNTFYEIAQLYVFAKMYDIQRVIRACRNFFNSILHVQNSWESIHLRAERTDQLLFIASLFNDDILRDIVHRSFKRKKDNKQELRQKCKQRNINLGNLICEYNGESPYFCFQIEEENDGDRSDFEFYN